MEVFQVAVVGGGSRGLGFVERLIALYKSRQIDDAIEIHFFNPSEPGQCIHSSSQSKHLLINAVASQISMFSDHSVTDAGPVRRWAVFF